MLETMRPAGVTLAVNLRFHCMQVLKHASRGIHSGLAIQGRLDQKSKTGVQQNQQKPNKKGLYILQIFYLEKSNVNLKS